MFFETKNVLIITENYDHSLDNLVIDMQSRLSDEWLMAANVFTERISLFDFQNHFVMCCVSFPKTIRIMAGLLEKILPKCS